MINIMKTHRALLLTCAAVLAVGCGDKQVQQITGALPGANIKFYNFGVNAPQVNFYADDQKMTAISSTSCTPLPTVDSLRTKCLDAGLESTTGTGYGALGAAGLYTGVTPGQHTFTSRIAATTDKDLVISSSQATLENGKFYSFYQSGFYNTTTKQADAFVVEDPMSTAIDWTKAYVRFVHAIGNANPMTMYAKDTTTGSTEVAVGGEVAYRSAGAFTALNPGVYNLYTRYTGSATNAISRTNVVFSAGRVYTISARGDITITSTTATNRPFLDNTANR